MRLALTGTLILALGMAQAAAPAAAPARTPAAVPAQTAATAPPAAPAPAPAPDLAALPYPELWEQATEAFRAREAERATALFAEVVRRTPSRGEAWFGLSRAHEWAGRMDVAAAAAERAQDLGWEHGAAWATYRVARLHAQAGHADQALAWLERALAERHEDRPEIAGDEAFAALRDSERFRRLAGLPPPGEATREQRWRFDLDYLVEEAQRMHAHPERPAYGEPFLGAAAALKAAVPCMTDEQIYLESMKLLALLGDGHTAIYGPDPDSPLALNRLRLPLKFYLFPEGLYIVDGIGEWAAHAGSRVLRFGDVGAERVLARMSLYRGVDNRMNWKWLGPQFYVGSLALLQGVGAARAPEAREPAGDAAAAAPAAAGGGDCAGTLAGAPAQATEVALTLEAPGGKVTTITVPGGEHEIQRKLRPSPATKGDAPLWLSRVDSNYWIHPLPEHAAVYFQFNQVRDAESESIAQVAERLRATLKKEGARRLIVDVRHNNGGNNNLVRPLVRALVEFEMGGEGRSIVVITGRNTFSAAQNFINRVEQWTDARFAGEPSSSSPNFVGEETGLLLPYSRLRGSISSRYWQDSAPGDTRPWIDMDIPVELTAADYFAGRDPVLEAVLKTFE